MSHKPRNAESKSHRRKHPPKARPAHTLPMSSRNLPIQQNAQTETPGQQMSTQAPSRTVATAYSRPPLATTRAGSSATQNQSTALDRLTPLVLQEIRRVGLFTIVLVAILIGLYFVLPT